MITRASDTSVAFPIILAKANLGLGGTSTNFKRRSDPPFKDFFDFMYNSDKGAFL
jgi:hypothetical protein